MKLEWYTESVEWAQAFAGAIKDILNGSSIDEVNIKLMVATARLHASAYPCNELNTAFESKEACTVLLALNKNLLAELLTIQVENKK